jgi:thioredoxin reductase (NADPH)
VNVEQLEHGEGHEPHKLHLDCGATARAQTVLIATGMYYRRLAATNAEKFDRQGIYYACTSVEGFIHQGQDVAVVGAGNSAVRPPCSWPSARRARST